MTNPSLTARRQAIIDHAHKIGISDDYIDLLVESFYQRIRVHPILGPVFNDAIGDNWPHHLAQMKNFWASVTLNSGRYSGQPVPAHKKHLGSRLFHDPRRTDCRKPATRLVWATEP